MAVQSAMFVFEVVVEKLNPVVENRYLVIRASFADVFSLEMKDPKQLYIVMPEPQPLPPEPVGKKGKKKKPKPKKKKKGKKGKEPPPPPEPAIQAGQSVLFTSTAEFLTQQMRKFPLEVSVWNREDDMSLIGSSRITWDPVFFLYLQSVFNCKDAPPPIVKDEYNIFEEGTAKLIAKIVIQIKLTHLTSRMETSFRTLSEDPVIRKVLYTGMNSKVTSYIVNYKTTDEDFDAKSNLIENKYTVDKMKPIVYADYKNAPGAKLPLADDNAICCYGSADKPPDDIYAAPETCPDIDFICDYVRKIISSCNDNMRMLTPRPTIKPRVRATDIERLCYCKETNWPAGDLAERFRKEVQEAANCPICRDGGKKSERAKLNMFDIQNVRGPCGRADCKIARDIRDYLIKLYKEDQKEVVVNDIVGPCGSRSCTLANRIQDFIRHKGVFKHGRTEQGLSTQCACLEQMQDALESKSCESICSKDCEDSEEQDCGGTACPNRRQDGDDDDTPYTEESADDKKTQKVYAVYYFTVHYDKDETGETGDSRSPSRGPSPGPASAKQSSVVCTPTCPGKEPEESCSRHTCNTDTIVEPCDETLEPCDPTCVGRNTTVSPADSDIEIPLSELHNMCCLKSCTVGEDVKNFIVDTYLIQKNRERSKVASAAPDKDPCYCDCDCDFKSTRKTTYCPICGGYEALGDDVIAMPEYAKPQPCPIYHKLFDKNKFNVQDPFAPTEIQKEEEPLPKDKKQRKSASSTRGFSKTSLNQEHGKMKIKIQQKPKKVKKKQDKKAKETDDDEERTLTKHQCDLWSVMPVPRNMGWLWTADDIPGMKPWPKAWRPGAIDKRLVSKYRMTRQGYEMILKKKRALLTKKKKVEMKPALVITKTDGEYTVSMEVLKKYSKERLLNQYPYEESAPPLVYTIGKTEETKNKIQKQRERRERRENRRKARLIQSTFKDRCQEICVKAYNQAIGVLPLPNANMPDCPCTEQANKPPTPIIDSCSCSDSNSVPSSDSDGDDWVIQFIPPVARWNPDVRPRPAMVNADSHYTYLDYKVKLYDKQGNPIPRFFKGPDGATVCSDLGGFWGPDHVWQEINKDGYIGPDNRWVPLTFIGPDGSLYTTEEGNFTDPSGATYFIGVDGYIDAAGKWCFYPKSSRKTVRPVGDAGADPKARAKEKQGSPVKANATTTTNASNAKRSKFPARPDFDFLINGKFNYTGKHPGIIGTSVSHAKCLRDDVESQSAKPPVKFGAPPPPPSTTPLRAAMSKKDVGKGKKVGPSKSAHAAKSKTKVVMNVAMSQDRRPYMKYKASNWKMDSARLKKYREIMAIDDMMEARPPPKMSRASNTTAFSRRNMRSPYTDTSHVHMPSILALSDLKSSEVSSFRS